MAKVVLDRSEVASEQERDRVARRLGMHRDTTCRHRGATIRRVADPTEEQASVPAGLLTFDTVADGAAHFDKPVEGFLTAKEIAKRLKAEGDDVKENAIKDRCNRGEYRPAFTARRPHPPRRMMFYGVEAAKEATTKDEGKRVNDDDDGGRKPPPNATVYVDGYREQAQKFVDGFRMQAQGFVNGGAQQLEYCLSLLQTLADERLERIRELQDRLSG